MIEPTSKTVKSEGYCAEMIRCSLQTNLDVESCFQGACNEINKLLRHAGILNALVMVRNSGPDHIFHFVVQNKNP